MKSLGKNYASVLIILMLTRNQRCGSKFTESGLRSRPRLFRASRLGPKPGFWWPNNGKLSQFFYIYFIIKNAIYFFFLTPRERLPSSRRSLLTFSRNNSCLKDYIYSFRKYLCSFWILIYIRNLNLDLDPQAQLKPDPDARHCLKFTETSTYPLL